MNQKIKKQKGFIPIVIAIVVIALVGTGYGIGYSRASNIIREAQHLAKEEKYDKAIELLELNQNKWFIKNLGIKKTINSEIERNKKLLEDKLEYTQGIEEFEKGNFEKAKELLLKVSEISPHYQEAKNKIEKAKEKISEKEAFKIVKEEEKKEEEKEISKVTCQNECSLTGLKRCSNNGYQICGNYDADECLEWSSIINCPVNTICQGGVCTQQEQKCSDGTLYSQCSINKPKYCQNGILVDKCSICGCAVDHYCDEISNSCILAEKIDILIFVSPQYANNTQVREAIIRYIDAVKKDIDWDAKIINITPELNDFIKIDRIIEDYYRKTGGRLKGSIMVGEDIDTALFSETFGGQENPSITPWATNDDYRMWRTPEEMLVITDDTDKTSEALKGWKVVKDLKRVDIVISLLYPPHNLDYQTRVQLLRSTFEKFSENRNKIYRKEAVILIDPEIKAVKEASQALSDLLSKYNIKVYYKDPPTREETLGTLTGEFMLYLFDGHGNPSTVGNFNAQDLSSLNTPFFVAGGCYTAGWWSNPYPCTEWECNGWLDYSINENWFGAKIFTNPHLRVAVLGMPSQGGTEFPQRNFIGMAIPDLLQNKTLAESLKGDLLWGIDDVIIYGDLTFHYNF